MAIGNPQRRLRFVHVAGTNGKGTVCHMVSAVLQCAGHRVGLFTSPHLIDFRERIRINGECISESAVVDFVDRWQAQNVAWGTPSFFELTFAMAMDEFERQGCDIVVLETGMGGRLDSTNVIPSQKSLWSPTLEWTIRRFWVPTFAPLLEKRRNFQETASPLCWDRCARMPNQESAGCGFKNIQ